MAWTKEQEEAINAEGKNIIVSAGAGSGKTAVLTARVERKLLEGTHINELLVLTFTNAAAAEMKERIRKTINKNKDLEKEKDLIDQSYITTFDAFSLAMLKKYHTRLNITNNIKVCDEVSLELKKKEILEEIFNEYYLSPKQDFIKLIKDFCLKDDKELLDYILASYKKIEIKYNKEDYINNFMSYFAEVVKNTPKEYEKLLLNKISDINNLIKDMSEYFDGEYIEKVKDNFKKLLEATSYKEILNGIDYNNRLNVPKGTEEAGKTLKANIFGLAKEIKDLCLYSNLEEMQEEILSTKSNVEVLITIIRELHTRLTIYKQENDIFTFNDIAHLVIKVIEDNDDIREELTNSFKEILVDEYQDTSDTQEKFISLISNNNVYMVGDIKQSIYRFRNANPNIFKYKYETYRDTDQGIKIDLLKNFRSRDEVLANINLIFDQFMDAEIGGAAYRDSHRMVFGNNTYIEEGKTDQDYNMNIITYNKADLDKVTKEEEEAFIIGNDIKEKIENHYQVFDKDEKELRDITYNDFVILLDKSKNFDLFKKIFEYLGIPLTILKETTLNKDNDILVIKSLLKLLISIKNNNIDKYSFLSVSRSYLYKISDEEIYDYLINDKLEESDLYKKCLELVTDIDLITPSQFINKVLDYFNYDEKLLEIGNIKSFRTRLEYLINLVKDYENLGHTIYDFVDYLDEIFDSSLDLKFNINSEVENSVRIMTIHKSKGLEFPVCYFANFSSHFNIRELSEKIILDNKYGFVLPKVANYYKDTILKTLLKEQFKKDEISERIRLLYVALTRAKEKMIIVLPEEEETIFHDFVPTYERIKYNSFESIMKSIYTSLLPFVTKTNVVGTKDYLKAIKKEKLEKTNDVVEVKELEIASTELEETHYSKESLHIITKEEQDKMDFGTKVHEVLELIDFNNPNYEDFDISNDIKNKVSSFINSDFLKPYLKSNLYKEYEFIYQEDNKISHGIIDLLIETDNEMIIVDYKLKNIDDEAYDKQLNGYRKVIEEKTNKKTSCYLYSIIDEKKREVLC